MNNWSTAKRIGAATLVAGTLDILAAIGMTLAFGRPVDGMLHSVASAPSPGAKAWGAGGAALGHAVHFTLMAIMAAVFVSAANRIPRLKAQPIYWGVAYGLITYVAMDLLVVPLRLGTFPANPVGIASQLLFHILLVGVPIALIARR